MSPLDLLVSDAPEIADPTPFSARLAQRRLTDPSIHRGLSSNPGASSRPSERRTHLRRSAKDLEWLRSVRLIDGPGCAVTLVDLSEGGALIEVDAPLRPGARLTLEIAGGGLDASVPIKVLRSYVAKLQGDSTFYRGACVFAHAIDLPSLSPTPGPAPATPFVGTAAALRYLLDRCDAGAPSSPDRRVMLARPDLVKVLESIHARGSSGGDAIGRGTVELLGAVLPALQRGNSQKDAAAALECRLTTLPRHVQADLRDATKTLESLIARCFPLDAAPSTPSTATPILTTQSPAVSDSGMQKIVVRFADGDLLKGFTQDFHPTRSQFSLWPSINATPADRVNVPMSRLKAVFFVRDFEGNPGYRDSKTFTLRGQGRRVEVTFADTEVVLGTTLNYRPDAAGFFVVPADTGGNNTRIFVVASAVRRVRFV